MIKHLPGLAATALATSLAFGAARAADPAPSQFEYDANGNLTKVTDPLGRVTNHQYDLLNQRTSTVAPAPAAGASRPAVGLGYDGQGNIKSVLDPKSLSTTYTRDGLGNAKSISSPDTGLTRFTYDAAGNVKTRTDARGVKVTYTYDGLNRLTRADYSDGTSSQSWLYDQGTNGVGRLTSAGDLANASWLVWTFNGLGQVTVQKQVTGTDADQRTFLTLYKYGEAGTAMGKVELMTYPSGAKYHYTYGADGQIERIAQEDGTLLLSVVKRQPFGGAPMVMADGNGNVVYRDFDEQGRMRFYTREQGQAQLDWDDANRLKALFNPAAPERTEGYEYDDLDRLTNWTSATSTHAYTYDGSGDRLTHSINANSRSYTYPGTSHRLTNLSNPSQDRSYDAAGHMTGDGTRHYIYDGRGRLVKVKRGSIVTDYVINAMGLRVKKSSTNSAIGTRHFVYNDDGQLIGEYDAAGAPLMEYVYADEQLVTVIKFTGTVSKAFWVESDHLGSPRVLKDKTKQVRWRWESDPYGMLPPQEKPTAGLPPIQLNLRMPGQYFDAESGLFYNWHRDYDAGVGRYVQSDPIGLRGGANTYSYTYSNPLSYVDPKGLQSLDNPFGSFVPPDPYNPYYQRRDPRYPPTAAELECMRKYIRDKYGAIGLKLIENFSLLSYVPGNGNLVIGGPTQAWMSTAEVGTEKLAGLATLIQGGTFLQSAALTSEAIGMGGSASTGMFVTGTISKAAGRGIEKVSKRVAIPAAVVASIINIDARERCDCGKQ